VADGKSRTNGEQLIALELNPASGVDVLGDAPVLWSGMYREFTRGEADALLALRNEHGTPICRFYSSGAE
jgi:hypothetical protein